MSPASPRGWSRPLLPRRCPSGPQPGRPRSYLDTVGITTHGWDSEIYTQKSQNAKNMVHCIISSIRSLSRNTSHPPSAQRHWDCVRYINTHGQGQREMGRGPKPSRRHDRAFSRIRETVNPSRRRQRYWLVLKGTSGGGAGCEMSGFSCVSGLC